MSDTIPDHRPEEPRRPVERTAAARTDAAGPSTADAGRAPADIAGPRDLADLAAVPAEPDAAGPQRPAAEPAGPAPLGVERPATADARVDARLARLGDVDHLPTDGHIEVYEDVHQGLRDALSALDARPASPAYDHRS